MSVAYIRQRVEAKKARDFFYNELKKTALQLPLSEKAMAAVVFAYGRDTALAKACIAFAKRIPQGG